MGCPSSEGLVEAMGQANAEPATDMARLEGYPGGLLPAGPVGHTATSALERLDCLELAEPLGVPLQEGQEGVIPGDAGRGGPLRLVLEHPTRRGASVTMHPRCALHSH